MTGGRLGENERKRPAGDGKRFQRSDYTRSESQSYCPAIVSKERKAAQPVGDERK